MRDKLTDAEIRSEATVVIFSKKPGSIAQSMSRGNLTTRHMNQVILIFNSDRRQSIYRYALSSFCHRICHLLLVPDLYVAINVDTVCHLRPTQ